jgi:dimeric dUTPase (all-alpha-NTP-PPase superfamily)
MNLTKLFEMQKVLRNRIAYDQPDRFNKLILALLVELGECANEWRGFKFWSKNQEPRTCIKNTMCTYCDEYDIYNGDENPLLEEYVDGLHFVLELGIDIDRVKNEFEVDDLFLPKNVEDSFLEIFHYSSSLIALSVPLRGNLYDELLQSYIFLGELLGFTWEQIEQSYYDKNQINHERQNQGY